MFELTDWAFANVQPLLPANSRRGKPWRDHRQVAGRHPLEAPHRTAVAGCPHTVRALADLLQPAASLAG